MNWLAHIFLSEQDIDFQIGNYLADPLKGKYWENSTSKLKKGIKTHILIDSFTDSHHIFIQSKKRIRDTGLLRSIAIDITYDYLLTKNWNLFCNIPFEEFTQKFYFEAKQRLPYLPNSASKNLEKIIKYQVLDKYKSLEDLEIAFKRFDKRLSAKLLTRDSLSSYTKNVIDNIDTLEKDFLIFFPQLSKEVKENLDINKISHWNL